MRISDRRIEELRALLREFGLEYSKEEAQTAGIAIIRFMIVKKAREQELSKPRNVYGKQSKTVPELRR